jgi:hypothetical protein
VPVPSFLELEALSQGQLAGLRFAMSELTPSRIPAGMYPSLLRNYETVGLYNFAVAHAGLPDDFVYQVVRAVFENQDEMIEAHCGGGNSSCQPRSELIYFALSGGHSLLPADRESGPDGLTTCLRGVGPTHLSSRLVQRNEEVETNL